MQGLTVPYGTASLFEVSKGLSIGGRTRDLE